MSETDRRDAGAELPEALDEPDVYEPDIYDGTLDPSQLLVIYDGT